MLIDLPEIFIETDNRKNRHTSRTTNETMSKRFLAAFDNIDLTDKKILDIGCCVAAFGYLCLNNGASHYTGVDIQEGYTKLANENLGKLFSTR